MQKFARGVKFSVHHFWWNRVWIKWRPNHDRAKCSFPNQIINVTHVILCSFLTKKQWNYVAAELISRLNRLTQISYPTIKKCGSGFSKNKFFQNIIRDELKFIKTKRKYAAYSCCFDLYVSFSFHDLISSIRMLYLYSIHCFFLICRSTFLHIDNTVLQATQLKYNK